MSSDSIRYEGHVQVLAIVTIVKRRHKHGLLFLCAPQAAYASRGEHNCSKHHTQVHKYKNYAANSTRQPGTQHSADTQRQRHTKCCTCTHRHNHETRAPRHTHCHSHSHTHIMLADRYRVASLRGVRATTPTPRGCTWPTAGQLAPHSSPHTIRWMQGHPHQHQP